MSELTLRGLTEVEEVVSARDWTARAESHQRRADDFLTPHLRRQHAGEPHPVWDFLFTYYSLRPRQLRQWHPGFGVVLADATTSEAAHPYLRRTGYGPHPHGVTVRADYLRSRIETVRFIARLMSATAARAPRMNCFGLHEWAMVYQAPAVRHEAVPLRLGSAGTDSVVESMPLRCSHFDAFRFFTEAAVGRNDRQLSRDQQIESEQPGCIHASMDIYKWAYKLGPLVASDLVMDALELAADARALDMCASPYDLRRYGFEPIAIETPAGRAEYVRAQQRIAERAAPLRDTLANRCELLLTRLDG
ncbi:MULTISPECIES: 3-methyladenine DNA glycosylase [unclassified Mycolicibacterium]|uniref:3-methyladenine DNA glycosylase n=1 Tax=unclassified Mycolicibacterium TaxID=2636767 RepID=UPI0012DD9831|nr:MULTISPECIES: 3-methyladenine DNA glycosylase [unclassified Mycolicibacterium]MUL85453.1 3-methyladenine DNA glycosylase [Mycolicibacterium sp. CBMA 329]MUL88783.1 3-methyladenine DNA glycosylase [Mycolicibacterium sp. CBMA 331]MUM03077.1 3-methyladenine DNA glycosylase [Mycolicibacterium sp. CBMA 334]MUM24873.1 3-methyladenine DNA glycosylase [Mycolicibacterium sp. CBMA 295]MUM40430.1 3-methyladenine DNA glycosylase [Mycolicibacterium sp. CBMA 247]